MSSQDIYSGWYPENDYRYYLEHSLKGSERKNHKYISRKMGRSGKWVYTYADRSARNSFEKSSSKGGLTSNITDALQTKLSGVRRKAAVKSIKLKDRNDKLKMPSSFTWYGKGEKAKRRASQESNMVWDSEGKYGTLRYRGRYASRKPR